MTSFGRIASHFVPCLLLLAIGCSAPAPAAAPTQAPTAPATSTLATAKPTTAPVPTQAAAATPTPATVSANQPKSGGQIVIALRADPFQLDPIKDLGSDGNDVMLTS